jgi:hypothetical protein
MRTARPNIGIMHFPESHLHVPCDSYNKQLFTFLLSPIGLTHRGTLCSPCITNRIQCKFFYSSEGYHVRFTIHSKIQLGNNE